MSESLNDMLQAVAGGWKREKKAREKRATSNAVTPADGGRPLTIKQAAFQVLETAYLKASANNTLPAHARQVMYAARPLVMALTGGKIWSNDNYFIQGLLPEYMEGRNQDDVRQATDLVGLTQEWNVVFDARGNLHEPHSGVTVPLGTLAVDAYLGRMSAPHAPIDAGAPPLSIGNVLLPTCGPAHRYAAMLFVEKEGFLPLLEAATIAERYDVAIISTKGMSVVACRHLVDRVCGEYRIPLLVLHDFDKAGFSICRTLQTDSLRYRFRNEIEVVDVGLRLDDVREYDLPGEAVSYGQSDPTANLRDNGATDDEVAFLCTGKNDHEDYAGQRVELNAFTSDQFIEWLESKLQENGITKVVPDDANLTNAFRRAVAIEHVNAHCEDLRAAGEAFAQSVGLPADIRARVEAVLREHPEIPWERAVQSVARDAVNNATAGSNGEVSQ